MLCSVKTKNSNCEILTKNLKDGVKDEKLLIFYGFTEKSEFQVGRVGGGGGWGSWKTNILGGGGLPKGGLGQLADLRGAWQERGTLCLNK